MRSLSGRGNGWPLCGRGDDREPGGAPRRRRQRRLPVALLMGSCAWSAQAEAQYVDGRSVAESFANQVVCYDYSSVSQDCSVTDEVVSRSTNQIRLARYKIVRIRQDCESALDCIAAAISFRTSFNPEAAMLVRYPTLTITREGFCRSRDQHMADANLANAYWINSLAEDSPPELKSSRELAEFRRSERRRAAEDLEGVYCWRFRRVSGGYVYDTFLDGIKQNRDGGRFVALVPRRMLYKLRVQ
jgi:hypothetical protein